MTNNIPASGQASLTATFSNLENGVYYILAEDFLGHRMYRELSASIDVAAPTGWIKVKNPIILNNGDEAVNSANVTLVIHAEDDSGVDAIVVRNEVDRDNPIEEGDWIPWTGTATNEIEMPWTLSSGDGNKTIYLQIRDIYGYTSPQISS